MKIKNFEKLAVTDLRKNALLIAEAGFQAIDTKTAIVNGVRLEVGNIFLSGKKFSLNPKGRLFVFGAGKCSGEAGAALEKLLGNQLSGGAMIDIKETKGLKKIRCFKGTHPLPSNDNIKASKELLKLLGEVKKNDFAIFVISGGGSTLLCLPKKGGSGIEVEILSRLFTAGAAIQEINIIRKHLSFLRGGGLAKAVFPARGAALIFSDVPGDNIGLIASSPTARDETTANDAKHLLEKFGIVNNNLALNEVLLETPKQKKYFENIENIMFVNNNLALREMKKKAETLGFQSKIIMRTMRGEAREVGLKILKELKDAGKNSVLLYGGETTVTIKNKSGKGGRNQELALSALSQVGEGELIMPFASDGRDNTDTAGAICDIITKKKAGELGFDIGKCLAENNSYGFFAKTGDRIITGNTGSNVSDLVVAVRM